MREVWWFLLSLFLGFLLCGSTSFAKDKTEATIEEIVVTGEKLIVPTRQTGETVYTGTEITRKGFDLSGDKGKTNIYEAISILPGITFENPDANNAATEQANVRIRGVRGYLGAMTVQGIPNYGGNPMGPRAYIYDLENFESIAVYKGAVPSDLGAGVGNRGGAIELRPRWAAGKTGFTLSQSLGSYNYKRTYMRIDTGEFYPVGSRFSLSYSYTDQDKWKGPGDMGPRNNINLTFVHPIGNNIEAKFWGNFNEMTHHKYRFFSYNQILDLDRTYRLDFNASITGVPAQDYLYYKFNKESHENGDFFTSLEAKLTDNVRISLRPYISKENARIWDGSENIQNRPGVQKRTRDIGREGVISEVVIDFSPIRAVAGYHYESADMKIYLENYWLNSDGSLTYRGYGVFATSGKTYINSPYAKLSGSVYRFNWQAGMKYFKFEDSDSEGYVTQYPGGVPTLVRAPDLDREGRTYGIWLPTAGVSYTVSKNLETYLSYGKNFIRPYAYMPLVSLYNRLRTQFQSAGVTLNDLFRGYDIEKSDNIDLGVRLRNDFLELNPTFFYSRHKNLLMTVTDSRILDSGKPINYQQNIGKASGYGFELGTNVFFSDWLTFYINPVYNHLTYDGNITYSGTTLSTDGRQIVDVPRWTVSTGLIFKYKNFEVIPQMKYLGKRYGDCEHKEEISSYALFGLKFSYVKEKAWFSKTFVVSLELDNVFNKKYVSVINAMDDAVTGTTYGVGPPFTVRGLVSFKF